MKLRRIVTIGFVCTYLLPIWSWAQLDKSKLCQVVEEIKTTQHVDLSFQSKFVGVCQAAVSENLPAQLKFEWRDYDCPKLGRIAILSDEMLFVENVRYAILIEKIKMRRSRIEVMYSIIELFHNKPKGKNTSVISKVKVRLQ